MSDQEFLSKITEDDLKAFILNARNGKRERRKRVFITIVLGIITPLIVVVILWAFNWYTDSEVRKNEEAHIRSEINRKFESQEDYSEKNYNATQVNSTSIINLTQTIDERFNKEDKRYGELKEFIYDENKEVRKEMNDGFLRLQQFIIEQNNGRKNQKTVSSRSETSQGHSGDTTF